MGGQLKDLLGGSILANNNQKKLITLAIQMIRKNLEASKATQCDAGL